MNKIKIFIFIYCFSNVISSQTNITGKVLSITKKPLPYVTIGIPNANIGTYSFKDGSFELSIDATHITDSIQFSHVGYKTKSINIVDLKQNNIVVLEEYTTELNEVIIRKQSEFEVTGIQKRNSSSSINISNPFKGAEVAVLINPNSEAFVIEEIDLNVIAKNLNNYMIRVKIYNVDEVTQLPNNNILTQEIKGVFNISKGIVKFKLNENIETSQPFFMAFEWLVSKEEARLITNIYNKRSKEILSKYRSSKCHSCSKVIYNNKTITFINNKSKVVDRIKLKTEDRKLIRLLNKTLPQLSFQTAKSNIPTFYRYTSFGGWYKYSQTLIANARGYTY